MEYLIGFIIGILLGSVLIIKVRIKRNKVDEWKNLNEEEKETFVAKEKIFRCEECGGIDFKEGPGGGSFGNIECANSECKTRYNNLGPFGIKRIK